MNTDDQPCNCESKAYFSRRIDDLEQKYGNEHAICRQMHEEHNQYRRANDDKMVPIIKCLQEQNGTLKDILKFMEEKSPVINRTESNFTTWDGIKEAAKNITLFSGAVMAVYGVFHLIKTFS